MSAASSATPSTVDQFAAAFVQVAPLVRQNLTALVGFLDESAPRLISGRRSIQQSYRGADGGTRDKPNQFSTVIFISHSGILPLHCSAGSRRQEFRRIIIGGFPIACRISVKTSKSGWPRGSLRAIEMPGTNLSGCAVPRFRDVRLFARPGTLARFAARCPAQHPRCAAATKRVAEYIKSCHKSWSCGDILIRTAHDLLRD